MSRNPRTLRLPDDLEAEIKRLAKKHDRSENGEIIAAIRQYVNKYAYEEASEHENDLSPEELAAECEIIHPGQTHKEYHRKAGSNGKVGRADPSGMA